MRRGLAVLLLLASCAGPSRRTMDLDDERRPQAADDPPPSPAQAPPERARDPREVAAEARDDVACEQEVKLALQTTRQARAAFSLLQACVQAHKLRNLKLLFTTPYRAQLFALGESGAYDVVAHVVANRGLVASDLTLAREAGVLLYDVASVLKAPARFRGRFVLFRGLVREQESDRLGRLVLEISETERRSEDRLGAYLEYDEHRGADRRARPGGSVVVRSNPRRTFGKIGSSDFSLETGRVIRADAPPNLDVVENDKEYVFLARFHDARIAPPLSAEDPPEAREPEGADVSLVRWYPLGVVLPEIAR